MNLHRYRLIFDPLRGCLVVVSELARSRRKAPGASRCAPNSPRAAAWLLSLGLVIAGSATHAQVVQDRTAPGNQQPGIGVAPNGVTLVNIQTTSAGGVSRNTYERFDVLREGVILNNSRTAVQTQLGGWITGNANLGAREATVILNEVNASTPSLLQGAIEVAGQRAQVIIANAAGITCNGCGFINAQRATLTTGQPIISNGNLDGYRVTQGTVRIEGAGLNAASADYTELIARAVTLNASLWARDLRITTGANMVNAANTQLTPLSASAASGAKPAFALDVAQLGGMYAGKIYLIGTEAGLGVRNAGLIGAGAGEVILRVDGKLENQSRIYGDHIAIAATEVINTNDGGPAPVIAARERLDIGTGTLINREHAVIASLGDIAIGGTLDETHHASSQADRVENASATIDAARDLTLSAKAVRNLNLHFSTGDEEVSREQLIEYTSPQSPIRYSSTDPNVHPELSEILQLRTPLGLLEPWTKFDFERTTIETRIKTTDPGRLMAGADLNVTADQLRNDHSQILAGANLISNAGNLENIDTQGQRIVTDIGKAIHYSRRHRDGADATRISTADYLPAPTVTSIPLRAFTNQSSAVSEINAQRGGSSDGVYSGLFHTSTDPSKNYLIETDPAFTSYRQWLASDYLLRQLAVDPATVQKRLGDGFYEQQHVRDQVAQLTGRRFLDGYASDDAQYQALMNNAVTFASAHSLRPGIALSKEQVAMLTSDIVWLVEQDVTLPNGEQRRALVPQVYVMPREGDLNGQGALLSGHTVKLNVSGDVVNSGTLAGRELIAINADNLRNLGGRVSGSNVAIAAATDIDNLGGTIDATQSLIAVAGRDLNVRSTTQSGETSSRSSQHSRTDIDRVAGLYVSGDKGKLIAFAGQDLNLDAAAISNSGKSGKTLLAAGNDVNLDTVTEKSSGSVTWDRNNWRKESHSTDIGTQIRTDGAVDIAAGNDVNIKAATIHSNAGDMHVSATRNVAITTGEDHVTADEAHRHKESGTFSSTTRTWRDTIDQRTAAASTLSGQTVQIDAGQQISVTGSDIVSTEGTRLAAGTNVVIDAASQQRNETHIYKQQSSGLMGSGGFGVTLGRRKQSNSGKTTENIARAATIGSSDGNVQIVAGKDYRQRGSDVLAPKGDIAIAAQRVDITEARETRSTQTETRFEQSGLTVAVSNPVITAVQTAQQMSQAAGNTGDSRMKALAAANTAMTAANAVDAVKAGQGETALGKENQIVTRDASGKITEAKDANAADKLGGISVNISLGSSKSRSNSTATSDNAKPSHIQAGGNIDITAKGAGTESDLIIQGSNLNAGRRLHLEADSEITLRAAANTSEQHSTNTSKSGSVGVSVNLGAKGGVGATASVSQGKGHGDGSDLSWTNTQAKAGNQVSLISGSDTNLAGAVVNAPRVTAEVGGHLNITSLQDSSLYESQQKSIGGSLTIPVGPGSAGGSLSITQSDIHSLYSSVNEQSGIKAGDEGFNVNVKGNTSLKGGVISSTESAHIKQLNQFSTGGTLTAEDIKNQANYNAQGYAATLGTPGAGQLVTPITGAGIAKDSARTTTLTRAAITGLIGEAGVRTGDQGSGLKKIFDIAKVQREIQASVTITHEFSRQANHLVSKYVETQRKFLREQVKMSTTDDEKKISLEKLDQLRREEQVMNILIGAIGGFGVMAVTRESLSAGAEKMRDLMIDDSKKFIGITDGKTTLSNISGTSDGVMHDELKIGGVRVDLDVVCGITNQRCEILRNSDGIPVLDEKGKTQLKLNEAGQVVFDTKTVDSQSLESFLSSKEAKSMVGPTGGTQGMKGSLFGIPYIEGSWQDKLIEAFSGPHDMIGGKLSNLYDSEGNIKRGMTKSERNFYDYGATTTAILPAAPFAVASLFPPEVWQAISIFLKGFR